MKNEILQKNEAIEKVFAGISAAVEIVKVTLGARGRNVLIKRTYIDPRGAGLQQAHTISTKDGITVLRNITIGDTIENMGADIVKEASEKTMFECGDATTTTCVLVYEIVKAALPFLATSNPYLLKEGIDHAVKQVVEALKKMAIPIGDDKAESLEKIRQIATVSANNDASIGDLIAEAYAKIGKDGIINIEQSRLSTTEVKILEGIKMNRGWKSPYFINNHAKAECVLNEPYILLTDKKISTLKQFKQEFFQELIAKQRSILIVCDDADGEGLAAFIQNNASGNLKACIVVAPEYGQERIEFMEDLAAITGGEFISDLKGGTSLASLRLPNIGEAEKVIVGMTETTIINGRGGAKLEEAITDAKIALSNTEDTADRERFERRLARLTGSVAVLSVGAPTEVEMREKLDRVDDAVRATRAAIAEGYVPGGGISFTRCETDANASMPEDFLKGMTIVESVLNSPMKQILENGGYDVETQMKAIRDISSPNYGFNVKTGKVEDLIASGIIDPVKALRVALENAASAAGTVITSGGLVCDTM